MREDFRFLSADGKSGHVGVSASPSSTKPEAVEAAGEDASAKPYDRVTIGLHWVSALTILTLWLIGQFNGLLPRGPLRLNIWGTHVVLGFVLALVIAIRIFWHLRHPQRPHDRGRLDALARPVHVALYGLMVIVVALGVTTSFLKGYNMFGVWNLPKLPGDPGVVNSVLGWHGLAANALIALALLHAAAALFHHFVLRDGVLRRMIPALRPRNFV